MDGTGEIAQALPKITLKAMVASLNVELPLEIDIPQGTTVIGASGWNGLFNAPQAVDPNNTGVTITADEGKTATITNVVEIGHWDVPLTTDKAVRIVFPGQAGKSIGYFRYGIFSRISKQLTADSQETGDALPDGGEGWINVGNDLVIWTKHFTQFVLYTQTDVATNTNVGNANEAANSGRYIVDEKWAEGILKDASHQALIIELGDTPANAVGGKSVELSADIIALAQQTGKSLVLQDNGLEWLVPVENLPAKQTIILNFATKNLAELPGAPVGTVARIAYNLTGMAGDTVLKDIGSAAKLTLSPPAGTADGDLLAVYRLNEAGVWEYAGGRISSGKLTVQVDVLSDYLVVQSVKTFADIQDHWAKQTIEVMAARQIATGMDDGHFAPNSNITRGEFAALLSRLLKLKLETGGQVFTDVKSGAWYESDVKKAASAGIIEGANGLFRPLDSINRQEMAVMIMRAYGQAEAPASATAFTDEGKAGVWASKSIGEAYSLGFIEGREDGSFGPLEDASRAEALTMLLRLMDKLEL